MPHERGIGSGESLQIRTRTVAFVLAAVLAMLALVGFGLTPFFSNRVGVNFVVAHGFPSPAVIADERVQRLRLEARQRRELAGADGRMPITQAMSAVAARGDRAFDPVRP
ncbi:MAG TPA: hypothetical protein VHV26_07655 [Rhizomicrobium sp.]|jgi:hypothetical protein|nr:hypothetical protein [Rhizomicrobium sp.]